MYLLHILFNLVLYLLFNANALSFATIHGIFILFKEAKLTKAWSYTWQLRFEKFFKSNRVRISPLCLLDKMWEKMTSIILLDDSKNSRQIIVVMDLLQKNFTNYVIYKQAVRTNKTGKHEVDTQTCIQLLFFICFFNSGIYIRFAFFIWICRRKDLSACWSLFFSNKVSADENFCIFLHWLEIKSLFFKIFWHVFMFMHFFKYTLNS